MLHERKILLIAVLLLVLGGLAMFFVFSPTYEPSLESIMQNESDGVSPTRSAAPVDVAVPDTGDTPVSADVAVPDFTLPAGAETNAKIRAFSLVARDGAFMPNTIAVRKGDTVNIAITAEDATYDFTQPDFGFLVIIPKGTTKNVEFNATAPGTFIFSCTRCEADGETVRGTLLISEQ